MIRCLKLCLVSLFLICSVAIAQQEGPSPKETPSAGGTGEKKTVEPKDVNDRSSKPEVGKGETSRPGEPKKSGMANFIGGASNVLDFKLTDAIQAFAALATLGLAFITYNQSKKVKTLTDVVEKLSTLNYTNMESLRILRLSTLSQTQPYFIILKTDEHNDCVRMELINEGKPAKQVFFQSGLNMLHGEIKKIGHVGNTYKSDHVELFAFFEKKNFPFDFMLRYEDLIGRYYEQKIKFDKEGWIGEPFEFRAVS